MLLVDGFGIPPAGWPDSIYAEYCPREFIAFCAAYARPLDAGLGVAGLPQSATGQSAILTGVNTAAVMNAHQQGFPGLRLRKIIQRRNLFKTLLAQEKTVTFANAYVRFSVSELKQRRLCSVTTVMADQELKKVRTLADLKEDNAVYHDLTRETLHPDFAGAGLRLISPAEAAAHLARIARAYDFTLFEYFQTDRAGHLPDPVFRQKILREFSAFVLALPALLADSMMLMITSDHGNCEEPATKTHTRNPVPLMICGPAAPKQELSIRSITEVHDLICRLL